MITALKRPPTSALLNYSSSRVPVGKHSCASPVFTGPRVPVGTDHIFASKPDPFTPGQRQGAAKWRTAKIKMRQLKEQLGVLQRCERAMGRRVGRSRHRRTPATSGLPGPRSPAAASPPSRRTSHAQEALWVTAGGDKESLQPPRPPWGPHGEDGGTAAQGALNRPLSPRSRARPAHPLRRRSSREMWRRRPAG